MQLKVNIFSIHYFLWFGALTSIYGYISVYSEHYANISPTQYGLLNMVLPFATIVARLFFCTLADLYQTHRGLFIIFLTTSLIGYGSFGILPLFIHPQPKELGPNSTTWTIICVMTTVATLSMSVVSSLTDSFAMNSSRKRQVSFGRVRVWGTFGWAISSLILSFINQISWLPLLVPGIFMTIILISVDILWLIFWPKYDDFQLNMSASDNVEGGRTTIQSAVVSAEPARRLEVVESSQAYGATTINSGSKINIIEKPQQPKTVEGSNLKTQWLLFKEIARQRKSIFRHLILFTISGMLISIQWSYFFLFLQKIFKEDFTYVSGVSMMAQALAGELPFFIISEAIVKTLGRSHTLSISIMSMGIRYLLYEFVLPHSGMYFVILTESFQGPNFSLFYVVLTEVGLEYSDCDEAIAKCVKKGQIKNDPEQIEQLRKALRATMQSLMGACYEGLGVGIGSIVGGLVLDYYGFRVLWIWSSVIAIVVGFINIIIELVLQSVQR